MANYPFKNKNYYDITGEKYDVIDFNATYYTVIGGVLMAIKPLAQHYLKLDDTRYSSPTYFLEILAANGKRYKLDSCCKIFRNYDEYLGYVQNPSSYKYDKFGYAFVRDALKDIPGIQFNEYKTRFYQYYWGNGLPVGTEGEILFWVDVDGPHAELKPATDNGKKLYTTKEECFKDNVKVVEFGDMDIEQKGEYTIKREFTVKAKSQEEAESIVDETIGKAYKEQIK